MVAVKVSIYADYDKIYIRACLGPDGEVRFEVECR